MMNTRPCLATGAAHCWWLAAKGGLTSKTCDIYIRMVHRPKLAAAGNKFPTDFMYGNTSFPKSINWTEKGVVTPVKFQGPVQSYLLL